MESSAQKCGKYELLEEISRGGSGIVYKAHDPELNRVVALKVLNGHRVSDPNQEERFKREARLAATLDHDGIVRIFDAGLHEGRLYFTMNLIAGDPLDRVIARRRPTLREAVVIAARCARVLAYAHSKGVIHRDIKPSNILIRPDGSAVLTDFGIAKSLNDPVRLTQTGEMIGTLQYMSPEQIDGDTALCDSRSDVYSLGAVLYEMLTGAPPFDGTSYMEISFQSLNEDPLPPSGRTSGCHHDLDTICLKALHRDPARRYQTADELAEDLERFDRGESIIAEPERPLARVLSRTWRRRRLFVLGAGVVLILAGLLIVVLLQGRTRARIDQYIKEGSRYRVEGRADKARASFEQVLAVDPENAEARRGVVDTYLDEAEIAVGKNEPDLAEKNISTAKKLNRYYKSKRIKELEEKIQKLKAASQ